MVSQTPDSNPTNYFVHTLLRARDWQYRPEFDHVCHWWRSGGTGVCGLVGMGGAGKTAIVDRFLRVLPGVMPKSQEITKDDSLDKPNSTFVFSFYDAPNAEAFFQHLHMWLMQSPDVEHTVSYSQLLFRLQNAMPGLIVLDGLEKVQEDGTRGVFGQLSAPNLRDFVRRAADGQFRRLSVLITTRFPLADLQEDQPDFFQSIPIEDIDILTGISLLRQRGVRGNDLELEHIVKECGNHALTVDLVGGYIKEYGNGEPDTPLILGTAEELEKAVRKEQDPAKRAVLKQGVRFARVAQRYQEAMLEQDPAAIALLERICLFRLGVEAETLLAIFTGEDAVNVSGAALAGLEPQELQDKLDWLGRMRIIEAVRVKDRVSGQHLTLYNVHPAVRNGFVQGIGRDIATATHKAIRTGLEVSLSVVREVNPSNPAVLDRLEEIVHHAIASGQVLEAWNIYSNKIGGLANLNHALGSLERGERICRNFASGQSPEKVAASLQSSQRPIDSRVPIFELPEGNFFDFINAWGTYLISLGYISAATHCFKAGLEISKNQQHWLNFLAANLNLADLFLLGGQIRLGMTYVNGEVLSLAKKQVDKQVHNVYSLQARFQSLMGSCGAALENFCQALHWQHRIDTMVEPLYSGRGIDHALLLICLGRHKEVQEVTYANIRIERAICGSSENIFEARCNLILSETSLQVNDILTAGKCQRLAYDWSLERDDKEILCWAILVRARIGLFKATNKGSNNKTEGWKATHSDLTEGLKIARDCGFGIYHIDLLLEQAHLHLFQGNSQAALADIRLALDDGIPANEKTGQPGLLAANDPECGYAWGIVSGLHCRAEALLLWAAHLYGANSFIPDRRDEFSTEVQDLISQAETYLADTMARWCDLRDPEVRDSNFIHPETNEEYNYRAAATYQVQKDLQGGLLTRYPLPSPSSNPSEPAPDKAPLSDSEKITIKRFNVALSFPGENRPFVSEIADSLAQTLGKSRVFYDRFYEAELARPNLDIYLQRIYHDDADLIVIFICEDYNNKDWCHLEARAIRDMIKQRRDDEIMFVRVDDGNVDGVFSVDGYVDAKGRPASDIAELIRQRLDLLQCS